MESAREFVDVQRDVAKLVEGRILIGHAIQNDSQVSRHGELVPWLLLKVTMDMMSDGNGVARI
jgi:hypothetical protein